MFTGIIEKLAKVVSVKTEGTNKTFVFESEISNELKVDQSVAHNGVCLTVTHKDDCCHTVTAIEETLIKSNLNQLKENDLVNLERCLLVNSRYDGHIVQGHVDTQAKVVGITDKNGSWQFDFELLNPEIGDTVEKGSITINGTSLTVFNSTKKSFSVAIIPFTYENTCFKDLSIDDFVNIEFDIVGKYIKRMMEA